MLRFRELTDRSVVELTGYSTTELYRLVRPFRAAERTTWEQADSLRSEPRKRQLGGGRKPALLYSEERLTFILCYWHLYPCQKVMGELFGMSQSQVCEWVQRLTPILERALGASVSRPSRKVRTLEELMERCPSLAIALNGPIAQLYWYRRQQARKTKRKRS